MKNLATFAMMAIVTYVTLSGGAVNTTNYNSFTGKVNAVAMNEMTKRSTFNFNQDVSKMMDGFTNAVIAFAD